MSATGWIAIGVAVVVVAVVVTVPIWWSVRRGHRVGNRGIVQRSRLTCPKCHEAFDYDWVAGVSFTAVRLGRGRYLRCPRCHRWSTFDLIGAMRPRASSDEPGGAGQTP